ncbi:FadR/GntR family transcriptional regulator [Niabella aquatica]
MMIKMITSIQRKSLAREVADLIRQQISNGLFPVGSKLPTEPELMKQFSVGRSTIREAGKYLAQSGFVHVKQGLGTFIISQSGNHALDEKIGSAGFTEVFEVRQLLELQIIEKSVQNRTSDHLAVMHQHLENRKRFAEQGDLEASIGADIDFHTAIAESCGNFILSELYKTLSLHVSKFFCEVYKDTAPFIISQKDHEKLLQYIQDRNKIKALHTAKKIIGNL